ncbi:MAG: hypothetical protein QG590_92, partial [Pseudomonadota bacterium]|nr:hypothetical protein [Pseudomonadota bacterium]
FDSFDAGKVGQSDFGASGRGFYFSQDPGTAGLYAQLAPAGDAPHVVPVYLRATNPLELTAARMPKDAAESATLTEMAREGGHDAIFIRGADGNLDEAIVFDPTQIKSAIGNSGRFDPNSASLTDPVPRAAATEAAPPKPAAEAGDPIAKLNEPADAKPKPAADPIMSTVATRVADLESTAPDMVVRIADDGKHVTLADDLAEVRRMVAEGTDDSLGTLDADLMRVAVECALSTGG